MAAALVLIDEVAVDKFVDIWLLLVLTPATLVAIPAALVLMDEVVVDKLVDI